MKTLKLSYVVPTESGRYKTTYCIFTFHLEKLFHFGKQKIANAGKLDI